MIVRDALRAATERLAATSETARLDAELLMAHALGESREAVILDHLDAPSPSGFGPLVERRAGREPLAYIIGRREFWSLDIAVGPDVLIPRPDSETLIQAAVRALAARPPATILDLGAGSGALLLAALSEWPDATGLGVDRSDAALVCARSNAMRLGFGDRAQFQSGDWGVGLADRYDLILCNPPYIETGAALMPDVADFEPREALFAEDDGLADYRRIVPQLPELQSIDGIACLELGVGQAAAVSAMCAREGLISDVFRDLADRERCLLIHSRSMS